MPAQASTSHPSLPPFPNSFELSPSGPEAFRRRRNGELSLLPPLPDAGHVSRPTGSTSSGSSLSLAPEQQGGLELREEHLRQFLAWQQQQERQQRQRQGLPSLPSTEQAPAGSALSGGKASRRESLKGLFRSLGGGKGKQREGEFEEAGPRTTLLWGWT